MSGAVAAHAAYNYTGTQDLAVTDRIADVSTGGSLPDYMSVFWNKNDTTKQLLYGSALVEVSAGGGSSSNSILSSNMQFFDVNNDIDCLGNLVLKVTLTNGSSASTLTGQQITSIIQRVEIQVGTQIWQTFEHADLQALAATELSKGSFEDYSFQTTGGVGDSGIFDNTKLANASNRVAANAIVVAFIPLKLFTKTLAPHLETFAEHSESGYLMAAAPNQSVRVKVYTVGGAVSNFTEVQLTLYAVNHVMCETEREQMRVESASTAGRVTGMPKRIKMTQNQMRNPTTDNAATVELDLDHFSLYASHLIISFGGDLQDVSEKNLRNAKAELLLNSTSFSSKLPLGLLKLTASSIGLNSHEYRLSETSAAEGHKGIQHTFVFPLASRAYGGSSVPLNRFDNIRLKLTELAGAALNTGTTVSVTCVGETTALYKNGAASLAMY